MRVLRADLIRAGFRPQDIVNAAARGRVHDPNRIVRVEVTIVDDAPAELGGELARRMAVQAAAPYLHGNHARRTSDPYRRGGLWAVRYEVES